MSHSKHWISYNVSYIFIYYRGRSKKVYQLLMPLEQIYNKNLCFDKQKRLL
jgi:hypothetical protein